MLSRIAVHHFAARSLLTPCRAMISRYFAPTCSHRRLLSDSPTVSTTAGDDRRWVMLSSYGRRCLDDSTFAADANTIAECRTSKGQRVRVSFRCAVPPSSSYLYYDFPDAHVDEFRQDTIRVIGAHGELLLLEMCSHRSYSHRDHFVYRPAGARRPPSPSPSLSLLPAPDSPIKPESFPASYFDPPIIRPRLDSGGIGLLPRGENDLLVVHVELWYNHHERRQMAVFCVLRPSMRRWELMQPVPIDYGSGSPQNVISVGDRFLCWVSYGYRFLLCDMADEVSPKVHYVCLPPQVRGCSYGIDYDLKKVRCMGPAGDSCVRFVSIHPNCCKRVNPDHCYFCSDKDHECCCREDDSTQCCHPRFVFTIKTWMMDLSVDDEPLEWVEDGQIEAEEIWALPGYEGLPQAIPEWPVVCLGEPNVVCFLVSNYHFTTDAEKVWMVQLDIDTKTLLSVVQVSKNDDCLYWKKSYDLSAKIQD